MKATTQPGRRKGTGWAVTKPVGSMGLCRPTGRVPAALELLPASAESDPQLADPAKAQTELSRDHRSSFPHGQRLGNSPIPFR